MLWQPEASRPVHVPGLMEGDKLPTERLEGVDADDLEQRARRDLPAQQARPELVDLYHGVQGRAVCDEDG